MSLALGFKTKGSNRVWVEISLTEIKAFMVTQGWSEVMAEDIAKDFQKAVDAKSRRA